MNLIYLGDALDHWKGSLLEGLQQANILNEFAVDSMLSDPDDWSHAHFSLYRKLLRIQPNQLVEHQSRLSIERTEYFKEIPRKGDIFLDPDTGIATGKVSIPSQYIKPADLHDLLDQDDQRLLAIYQHIRAQKTRLRLKQVVASLKLTPRPFNCCSYESGTVAMLFLSRSFNRVETVYCHLRKYLNGVADDRISIWRHMQ